MTGSGRGRCARRGTGRSDERRVGPAEATFAQDGPAGRALEEPLQGDRRDPLPGADRSALAGSACTFRQGGRPSTNDTDAGRRTARGTRSCGPSKPTPTRQAASTGPWRAWIPPPVAPTNTPPERARNRRECREEDTRPDHLGGDKATAPAATAATCADATSRTPSPRYDKRAYVFHGTGTVAAIWLWLRP